MRRVVAIALALGGGIVVPVGVSRPAGAATQTFSAEADAKVESGSPNTNFGATTSLRADSSPEAQSYLRFRLSGLNATVTRATLRLFATGGTADGPRVFTTDTAWSESTITFNSGRPARTSGSLDDKGSISGNTFVEFNVTAAVNAATTVVSFNLAPTSSDGVNFNSRQASTNRPQLILTTSEAPPPTQVLVGAGDIATCNGSGDEATASLLDGIGGTVFTTGDNAYDNGTASEFSNCYDPSWGRHKARTRPTPGNHDYNTSRAAGYFGYFGAAAGDPAKGYYSYSLGPWHVIALNSNCSQVGGCGPGSPQEQFLRAELSRSTAECTVAYWHHARFSSGSVHGSDTRTDPFWDVLYEFGAELILVGHDHVYERFAPQTPAGSADSRFGIRQFTIGTGGRSLYGFSTPLPNSEIRNSSAFGVLKLTLRSDGYDWQFVPQAGRTFTDSGSGSCHGRPQ